MLITLLSWIWIGICSFLCGFALLQGVFRRAQSKYWSLDLYIMMGLCILTVYAQTFSLFNEVAGAAVLILGIACLAIAAGFRKQLWDFGRTTFRDWNLLKMLIVLAVGGVILAVTVKVPDHFDTGLYHAQSIRWIEEYGVAKGLGNLRGNFAYNSSFFCLQALFSLKFLLGQSMHSMNGFIALVLALYAIMSLNIFRKKKIATSDLLKLGLFAYISIINAGQFLLRNQIFWHCL